MVATPMAAAASAHPRPDAGGGALEDCSILDDTEDNVTAMAEEERERHFESKVLLRMQLKALRRQVSCSCLRRTPHRSAWAPHWAGITAPLSHAPVHAC